MRHPKFGKFYGGKQPQMNPGWNQVLAVYDHKDDVDLYVGMLFEKHMPGAAVGPTQVELFFIETLTTVGGPIKNPFLGKLFLNSKSVLIFRAYTLAFLYSLKTFWFKLG